MAKAQEFQRAMKFKDLRNVGKARGGMNRGRGGRTRAIVGAIGVITIIDAVASDAHAATTHMDWRNSGDNLYVGPSGCNDCKCAKVTNYYIVPTFIGEVTPAGSINNTEYRSVGFMTAEECAENERVISYQSVGVEWNYTVYEKVTVECTWGW